MNIITTTMFWSGLIILLLILILKFIPFILMGLSFLALTSARSKTRSN